MNRSPDIGILTDEVSRDLREALDTARSWGISLFELREGAEGRFPFFTSAEVGIVDEALRSGARITAVSPGILKGSVADRRTVRREIDDVLPRAVEMAVRFECPLLIVFGFERAENGRGSRADRGNRADHADRGNPSDRGNRDDRGNPSYRSNPDGRGNLDDARNPGDRALVLSDLADVAETAAAAGLTVAVENEPGFWFDRPQESVGLLADIAHPALRVNWDPANQHWGGSRPDHDSFTTLQPFLANIHVKDYYPDDPTAPWRPVGMGVTPWNEILKWVVTETDLQHVTIETHYTPLKENSKRSLDAVRSLVTQAAGRPA